MTEICFICAKDILPDEIIQTITQAAFDRMKEYSEKWTQYGKYEDLYEKISVSDFVGGFFNHKNCYNLLTHKNILKRASQKSKSTDKNAKNDDLAFCIICHGDHGGNPSKVSKINVARDIFAMKATGSTDLKKRLDSIEDPLEVISKGIKYHSKCLLNHQKKIEKSEQLPSDQEIVDYGNINKVYLTAINLKLASMGVNSPSIDMNELVDQYQKMLDEERLPPPVTSSTSLRRYIKTLMQSDEKLMSAIDFYHHQPCKPTVVANKLLVAKLVCDEHYRDKQTDEIPKVAKLVRKEMSDKNEWEFNGTFENFEAPLKLYRLLKLVISGEKPVNDRKQSEIDTICSNVVQYIWSNFKSERQMSYKSDKDRGFEKHRLTPLSVGTALSNYKDNRSKAEIESLSQIGLSINYDSVERIVTGIATTLIEEAKKNELGIILPSSIKKGIRPVFAADNIDLGSDAKSFHGADLMIVQKSDPNGESLFPVCY